MRLSLALLLACLPMHASHAADSAPFLGVDARQAWAAQGYVTEVVPSGPPPGVPAELGGAGFEALAAALGFVTHVQEHSMGSPDAVPGGELNLGLGAAPASLRAEGPGARETALPWALVYQSLLRLDDWTDEFTPSLASHWRVEALPDGGQALTFRIDPRARWQTGQRVTAQDVAASWRLVADDSLGLPQRSEVLRKFTPPEVLSPCLLRTTTREPGWRPLLIFGVSMFVYPAAVIGGLSAGQYLAAFTDNAVPGSGRYLLEKGARAADCITFTRCLDWWGREDARARGLGNFARIRFHVETDGQRQLEMFLRGEIDLLPIYSASYWAGSFRPDKLEALGKGWVQRRRIHTRLLAGNTGFAFNLRQEPFRDARVRRAVGLLLDREAIIREHFAGEYRPMSSYFDNSDWACRDCLPARCDTAAAAALLDEAGWSARDSDGVRVNAAGYRMQAELLVGDNPAWTRVMQRVRADFARAGLRLDLKTASETEQRRSVQERDFQLAWQNWISGPFPNPAGQFASDQAETPGSLNLTGFQSAEVDSLCQVYTEAMELADRREAVRDIDRLLREACPYALGWYSDASRLGWWNRFGMPAWGLARSGDWHSLLTMWWVDPAREARLAQARAAGTELPRESDDLDYWGAAPPKGN